MEVDDNDTPLPIESSSKQKPAEVAPPSPVPQPEDVTAAATPSPALQSEPSQPAKDADRQEDEASERAEQSANEATVVNSQPDARGTSSAAADTTTAPIVIDNESQRAGASREAAAQSQCDEPIELTSSASSDVDVKDQQTQQVSNSQAIISQSDAIDLDTSSSNDGDDIKIVSASSADVFSQRKPQQKPQELVSLDLDDINSDSSAHSENEVQIADIPPPLAQLPAAAAEPAQPTSTVQSDVVEIIDTNEPSANAADNGDQTNDTTASNTAAAAAEANSVCANKPAPIVVESTHPQQKPIEIPENICTITGKLNHFKVQHMKNRVNFHSFALKFFYFVLTVNAPVDETITTTTSETLLPQSNITTA